jgi:diadenosine tetraphosphate (Ap4A) HIT family hydrolase
MLFQLHSQLKKDSIEIGRFSLCQLLLINDSQYPWFVLVPERMDLTEIYQLSEQEQILLQQESSFLASTLANCFKADKMNIAAIGNLVSQLHIHHIVRYKNDIAWPAPVWGKYDTVPYTAQQVEKIKIQVTEALSSKLIN